MAAVPRRHALSTEQGTGDDVEAAEAALAVEHEEPLPPGEDVGLRRGLGYAGSTFAVNAVLQLGSSVVTARAYGIEVIGAYALVCAPWFAVIQFSTISEQTALIRRLSVLRPRDPKASGLFLPVLALSTAITIVVAAVVVGLSAAALRGPLDRPDLVAPSIALIAGYVLLQNVSWNLESVLSAFTAARALFITRVLEAASFLALALALSFIGDSVWWLVWATVGSFAIGLAGRAWYASRLLIRPARDDVSQGWRELPGIVRFALRLLPGSIANGLADQAPVWILGAVSPVRTVGAYSRASGIAARLNEVGHRINHILFPMLVRDHERGDSESFTRDLSQTIRLAVVPLAFATSVLGGTADGVLDVYGSGFDEASAAFAFLLAGYSCAVLSIMLGDALIAVGRPGISTASVVGRSVIIVGVLAATARSWGVTATGVALLGGFLADLVFRHVYLHRTGWFRIPGTGVGRTYVGVLAAGGAAYAVARLVDAQLTGLSGTLAALAGGSATYVAIAITLALRPEERERLRGRLRLRRG